MNSAVILPTIQEIRIEAINVLIQNLGLAKTTMFLRENFSGKTDYLKIKEDLFSKSTVEDIYNDMLNWKKITF